MIEENACPHCGSPLPASFRPGDSEGDTVPEDSAVASSTPLLAPGSHDETFFPPPFGARVSAAEPDPILGEFHGAPAPPGRPRPRSDSLEAFSGLDLAAPPSASRNPAADESGSGEYEDEGPRRGASWATVLLASYASAMTLAMGWMLTHRPTARDEAPAQSQSSGESRVVVGRQAGLSRTVAAPEPIAAEHRATLKKPLDVGSLEVTPLEVRRGRAALQRTGLSGRVENRDGGKDALILRLRVRNTTQADVFAPLDQAYLREREKEVVDSFVETAGGQRVYPYPLAVESEWSIVGQDFAELRPGEAREVAIVTAPDAPPDSAGPFRWRVRLRTGIGRTDVIGVEWPEPKSAPSK